MGGEGTRRKRPRRENKEGREVGEEERMVGERKERDSKRQIGELKVVGGGTRGKGLRRVGIRRGKDGAREE